MMQTQIFTVILDVRGVAEYMILSVTQIFLWALTASKLTIKTYITVVYAAAVNNFN